VIGARRDGLDEVEETMGRAERLIELFRSTPDTTDVEGSGKVEVVVELEDHLHDPRVLPFFVSVIADPAEYDLARIECIKILRLWPPDTATGRRQVGRTVAAALQADDEDLVRQYAAMSLGPYVGDDVVFEALTTAVLLDEDVDVRHNALAAIEEAGPDTRTVELLRRLTGDPELGTAATRTLGDWDSREN
jgi:hypothetical protein